MFTKKQTRAADALVALLKQKYGMTEAERAEFPRCPDLTSDLRAMEHDDAMCVVWESGPFDWAVKLLGGEDICAEEAAAEMAAMGLRVDFVNRWFADVQAIEKKFGVHFEAHTSYSISVWEA